jgi:hypothetical protein
LAYQPPASNTFLSQQISHEQPANNTFLSEQTSTSRQPPAKRTGYWLWPTVTLQLLINSLPHFYVSFPDFYLLCSAKQRLLYKETSGMKLKW